MDRTLENIAAVATTDVNGFYSAGGVTVGSHDLVAISVDGKHRGIREDKSKVMRAYKTRGTPWTVIIDKEGIIRYSGFHITPEDASKLIEALKALN